jgi:hypothetical protein
MSSTAAKLAQLESLQATGTISIEAYLRMVQEVQGGAGAQSGPTALSEKGDSDEDDEEEELVGEDGEVDTHHRRRPPSPRVRPSSPAGPCNINALLEDEGGLEDDALPPATPEKPTGPVPDDPLTWASNTKVISTALGEVNFVRIGNSMDFVNEGRAKVAYQQVVRGCKKKMETQVRWVLPATLSLPPPSAEEASPSSARRVSPRLAARSPAAAKGPELAGHERDRKLPQKKEGAPSKRTLPLPLPLPAPVLLP